jgi:hypothetical protein
MVSATTQSSGKTLLTEGIGLLYGQATPTWGRDDAELRKVITSMLTSAGRRCRGDVASSVGLRLKLDRRRRHHRELKPVDLGTVDGEDERVQAGHLEGHAVNVYCERDLLPITWLERGRRPDRVERQRVPPGDPPAGRPLACPRCRWPGSWPWEG